MNGKAAERRLKLAGTILYRVAAVAVRVINPGKHMLGGPGGASSGAGRALFGVADALSAAGHVGHRHVVNLASRVGEPVADGAPF